MLYILKNLRICFKISHSFYQVRVEEGLSGGLASAEEVSTEWVKYISSGC